jgi:hypothetical protein
MVPDLIDDVKKIFEFQSFSYIRVCFTPTTIIFKWWDFNEFQWHVPIEKSIANQDIYDFSHHGSTSERCKVLNWRYLMKGRCKTWSPCTNWKKIAICTYNVRILQGGVFYTTCHPNILDSVSHNYCWCYRGGKSHIYPDSPLTFL